MLERTMVVYLINFTLGAKILFINCNGTEMQIPTINAQTLVELAEKHKVEKIMLLGNNLYCKKIYEEVVNLNKDLNLVLGGATNE